jgi:alginate O-acetyltransferase complex protein AlgJ
MKFIKKYFLRAFVSILSSTLSFFFIYSIVSKFFTPVFNTSRVEILIQSDNTDDWHFYYTNRNEVYSIDKFLAAKNKNSSSFHTLVFELPNDSLLTKMRIDPGNSPGKVKIGKIKYYKDNFEYIWSNKEIIKDFTHRNDISAIECAKDYVEITIKGEDPFIALNMNISESKNVQIVNSARNVFIYSVSFSLVLCIFLFFCFLQINLENIQKTKAVTIVFISSFLLIISLPYINYSFNIIPEMEDNEKRKLYDNNPAVTYKTLSSFPEEYEKYFNDHFGFRSLLVKINSFFIVSFFNESAAPNQTIIGKENWLFFSPLHDRNINRTDQLYPKEELLHMLNIIQERALWLKKKGIKYYVVIPPDKSVIYPEYLPENLKNINVNKRLDEMFACFKSDTSLRIIDLRKELCSHKQEHLLYFKTDTHWNMYGGYFAYRKIMYEIKKDIPNLKIIPKEGFIFEEVKMDGGDLAQLMNAPELYTDINVAMLPIYKTKLKETLKEERIQRFENGDTCVKKIMFLHDSFGHFLFPTMAESFENSVSYWTPKFNPDEIMKENPTIVVQEILSRFTDEFNVPNSRIVTDEIK